MKTTALFFGALYGLLSIVLGAFGAHAFKKILAPERLESYETAVRYQMYAALYLLIIGFFLKYDSVLEKNAAWMMILGAFLFCGSIYFLTFQDVWKVNFRFLGPVTPFGGLFMILSWAMLLIYFAKGKA